MNNSLKKTLLPAALGVAVALGAAACGGGPTSQHGGTHLTKMQLAPLGRISGFYFSEGGVAPGNIKYPLEGTVTITPRHGRPVTVETGRNGKFTVEVSVGTYRVTASANGVDWCGPTASTTVTANHTSTVSLGCYVP